GQLRWVCDSSRSIYVRCRASFPKRLRSRELVVRRFEDVEQIVVSSARAGHMSLPDSAELESCFLGHPTRRLVALGDEQLDARYGAFVEAPLTHPAKRTRGYPAAAMCWCDAVSDL